MIGHADALRQFPSLRVQRSNLGRGSGSPEGAALWQGSRGVRQRTRGVQRAPPFGRVWGCPPAHKGRPEGISPSGRRFGGCPSRALLIFPLPTRKGARGMHKGSPAGMRRGRHPASSLRGACDVAIWGGVPPVGRGLGVSASPQGASRGDRPLWQEVWRVSLQSFTNLPPSYQEGGQGDGSLLPTGSAAACRCSPGLGAPGAPRLPAIAGTR